MPVMEGALKDEELIGSWFMATFSNNAGGQFTEVGGLSIEVGVIDQPVRTGKGDSFTRKLPGIATYSEITLKRVLSEDKSMYAWTKDIRDGKPGFRCSGTISLYSIDGTEKAKWTFQNAWPSKWSASDMSAGTADPLIEDVTIQIEHLKREM